MVACGAGCQPDANLDANLDANPDAIPPHNLRSSRALFHHACHLRRAAYFAHVSLHSLRLAIQR